MQGIWIRNYGNRSIPTFNVFRIFKEVTFMNRQKLIKQYLGQEVYAVKKDGSIIIGKLVKVKGNGIVIKPTEKVKTKAFTGFNPFGFNTFGLGFNDFVGFGTFGTGFGFNPIFGFNPFFSSPFGLF
jgi:ribosomal protein L35AE/L33A